MSPEQEAVKLRSFQRGKRTFKRDDHQKTEAMKQSHDINLRKEDNQIERLKKLAENEGQTSAEESIDVTLRVNGPASELDRTANDSKSETERSKEKAGRGTRICGDKRDTGRASHQEKHAETTHDLQSPSSILKRAGNGSHYKSNWNSYVSQGTMDYCRQSYQ
ncbi:Protein CBG16968 [Caenorhabditis briggsae]|uniref:Protein CBG16968 n=1 Tax=Caenorhabditis briggsae TaxID=6238 RepID=A8XQ59_CAEBR|nr:Protein CBG16968 [Caenorhabditis briggsae]CAP34785.1 Protein CBG16968 [Caenorhabditis briggsae]